MKYSIVGARFDTDNHNGNLMYRRLTKVWKYSAEKTNPNASIILYDNDDIQKRKDCFQSSNNFKLSLWTHTVKETDRPLVLTDTDILFLGSLEDAFDNDFDIAYTTRKGLPHIKYPFNGGVIFTKPTEEARNFMQNWYEIDCKMVQDMVFHAPYRKKYAGQNQASLGYMLENYTDAKVIALPCQIYNAANSVWPHMTDDTRILHANASLRKAIFKPDYVQTHPAKPRANIPRNHAKIKYEHLVKLWKEWETETLEKEALREAAIS